MGVRGVAHCAWRHKKGFGINARKCIYCVGNDTHSGPDPSSLDRVLAGIPWRHPGRVSPCAPRAPLKQRISAGGWAGFGKSSVFLAEQPQPLACVSACAWRVFQETVDFVSRNDLLCPGWNNTSKPALVRRSVNLCPIISVNKDTSCLPTGFSPNWEPLRKGRCKTKF